MSSSPTRLRRRLGHGGLSLLVVATSSSLLWSASSGTASAAPSGVEPACADGTCVVSFPSTGGLQTFTVPTGVTALTADVAGAAGGSSTITPGGLGGRTTGTVAVQPGDELSLVVGGSGTSAAGASDGAPGGFGGGGDGGASSAFDTRSGGASGGGGSFLFDESGLLLAAGGGGGSTDGSEAGAGGAAGAVAGAATSAPTAGGGGQPGTVASNGAGGIASGVAGSGEATSAASLPEGGDGAAGGSTAFNQVLPGAGGGGGFHAGGGGGNAGTVVVDVTLEGGGGGGGAGFAAEGVTRVEGEAGVQAGDGAITLSYADGPPAASISFTSSFDGAVVGGRNRNVAVEATGSEPVVFSVDPSTIGDACTIDGASVTFAHVGTCAIRADQAADQFHGAGTNVLRFDVGQGNQTITFDPLPASGAIGDTVDLVATGGTDSGSPVAFSLGAASTEGACTIDGTKLILTGAGTCAVLATQAGTVDYKAAIAVVQQVTVTLVATTTTLAFDVEAPVFGQPVTATATVTGAAGTVQLSVDGDPVGAPVDVVAGRASFALPAALPAGGHPVEAAFTPTDPATYGASSSRTTLAVGKATTRSSITVRADEASVVVAAVAPGSGTPEGTVRFTVGDGTPSAPVTLVRGRATLSGSVPGDTDVSVAYSGDDDFAASSDSTLRQNPTIEASVSSELPKSPAGWYRTAVTISFTCDPGSAPLVGGCPADVTLSDDGAAQGVTRTVLAEDGGIATVSVTGINIDRTMPVVTAFGVEEGARFFSTAPEAGCIARDSLSGVELCAATRKVKGKAVTYTVAAADQAGNVTTEVVHATTYSRGIVDAPYEDGAYIVSPGQAVTLVAKSSKRPQVYKPVEVPKKPSKSGDKFTATENDGEWALGYTVPTTLKPGKTYNLGIRTTSRHTIQIRVVA